MKDFIKYLRRIDRAWLITWASIYGGFLLLDFFFPNFFGITILKYLGILLNLIYSFVKWPRDHLLQLALLFTLLADTILVVNSTAIAGVAVFIVAQFFHLARLAEFSPRYLWLYFIIALVIFAFGVYQNLPPMYALCFIYAGTLGANLYLAYRWFKKSPKVPAKCAFFGFLLFAACDINVALSYLSVTHVLPLALLRPANYLAWGFYYPSQVLIANSSKISTQKS